MPLLLVRGEDAVVRAFLNICRHRGGRVFSGRGRPGRALKCPYHSWAYVMPEVVYGRNEPALIHHHQRIESVLRGSSADVVDRSPRMRE